MNLLTCIIPCYNEEKTLNYFYESIIKIANEMKIKFELEMEIIFVNDGSFDNTLEILKDFSNKDTRIKYISFSRNFGKESAMYAGLQHSKGDYVVILDADMQDPPDLIPKMYEILQDNKYDSVATYRVNRKGEPPIRSMFVRAFYKIINKISDLEIVDGARDFRMMKRKMVEAITSMGEYNRFSKGIFNWVGFNTKWLPYENIERVAGETKWSFWKLFRYSLEGIIAFSTLPLTIVSIIGIIICIISIIYTIFIVIRTLIFDNPIDGWPSLVCIVTFIGGLQLFSTGILGQYLAKTYLETKKRPIYIISEKSENN